MKYIYLLFLLFVLDQSVFAQINFQPGYLVTSKGDTLKGHIDAREWANNPEKITFKNTLGQTEIYTPVNAAGFGVNGETYYDRFIVQLSTDERLLSNLSLKPKYVTDTVFLRKLANGKHLSLYDYTDATKTRYIIVDAVDGQARELAYHILADSTASNVAHTTYGYRNQLAYCAKMYNPGNSKLERKINTAEYSTNLIAIVNDINKADKKEITANKRTGLRFFAGASINSATLKYSGLITLAENPVLKSSTFVGVNAGLDFFQNAAIGKIIYRLELGFAPYHTIESQGGTGPGNSASSTQQQQTFNLSPQVIYNVFNQKDLKAFISFGVGLNISSYKNSVYTLYSPTTSVAFPTSLTVTNDFPKMAASWLTYPIGAGVTISNRLQIYGNYLMPASVTSYSQIDGAITTVRAGINYLLPIKR